MFVSGQQTAEQDHSVKAASKFFINMAKFKCLGTMITSQNCMNGKK
jgi:hypothetical protein